MGSNPIGDANIINSLDEFYRSAVFSGNAVVTIEHELDPLSGPSGSFVDSGSVPVNTPSNLFTAAAMYPGVSSLL